MTPLVCQSVQTIPTSVSFSDSNYTEAECQDFFKLHKELKIPLEVLIRSKICKLVVTNKWAKIILNPSSSIQPYIVNLSRRTLSADEESLLSKGLKFCPTPGSPNFGELRSDLNRFHRSLR